VALIIQIHLRQNRADLAAKEAQRARKWAQDSLLVNLAESWVGMREVHSPPEPSFRTRHANIPPGRRQISISLLRV
jgi:hypothetical protein